MVTVKSEEFADFPDFPLILKKENPFVRIFSPWFKDIGEIKLVEALLVTMLQQHGWSQVLYDKILQNVPQPFVKEVEIAFYRFVEYGFIEIGTDNKDHLVVKPTVILAKIITTEPKKIILFYR